MKRTEYKELIDSIEDYRLNFNALKYASLRFDSYLRGEHSNQTIEHEYISTEQSMSDSVMVFKSTNGKDLVQEHLDYAVKHNGTFEAVCDHMIKRRAHIIRKVIINSVYEDIINYNSRFNEDKLLNRLQEKIWFKALAIIRNHASHANRKGKELDFPNFVKENEINYIGIKVKKGMQGDYVRYNSAHVLYIIDEIISYLKKDLEK